MPGLKGGSSSAEVCMVWYGMYRSVVYMRDQNVYSAANHNRSQFTLGSGLVVTGHAFSRLSLSRGQVLYVEWECRGTQKSQPMTYE